LFKYQMHLRLSVRPWAYWSENEMCSGALLACYILRQIKCTVSLSDCNLVWSQWRSV